MFTYIVICYRLLEEYKETPESLDINCVDPLNRSALIAAIENENVELIRILLEAGIKVKVTSSSSSQDTIPQVLPPQSSINPDWSLSRYTNFLSIIFQLWNSSSCLPRLFDDSTYDLATAFSELYTSSFMCLNQCLFAIH